MAKNHTPIMMTENEKREYFGDLVYLINDVESIKHRNENLTKLESFLKSNREFPKIKIFRRKYGYKRRGKGNGKNDTGRD